MHSKQPRFTSNAYGPFTKHKEWIWKFGAIGDSRYIYQSELGKACFWHNMTYNAYKDSLSRVVTDKVLRDKAKRNKYQRGLASLIYNFFW